MRIAFTVFALLLLTTSITAQTNPLWREEKVKNYLPHMRASVERLVDAAVRFIDRWKELRPIGVR